MNAAVLKALVGMWCSQGRTWLADGTLLSRRAAPPRRGSKVKLERVGVGLVLAMHQGHGAVLAHEPQGRRAIGVEREGRRRLHSGGSVARLPASPSPATMPRALSVTATRTAHPMLFFSLIGRFLRTP